MKINAVIKEVAGKEAIELVNYLQKNENVSEFDIAEHLCTELNTTRSLLYKLHKENLVSSIKKRDANSGWYVYFWSFKRSRVNDLIKNIKVKRLEELKNNLSPEEFYFVCNQNCANLDFENATNLEFKCPECGLIMNQKQNNNEKLKKEITLLESEIQ